MLFRDKTMLKIEILFWVLKSSAFRKLMFMAKSFVFLCHWKCHFVTKQSSTLESCFWLAKSRVFGKLILVVNSLYFYFNGNAVSWRINAQHYIGSQDSMEFHGIPWNPMEFHVILCISMEFRGQYSKSLPTGRPATLYRLAGQQLSIVQFIVQYTIFSALKALGLKRGNVA